MKTLIAEDDLTSRVMLSAMLKKWGYEPIVTENGRQAWDILQKPDAPKLILLDWMMPEMDGLQVTRQVRSRGSLEAPYIILLTARGEKNDVVQGLEAGANDYVLKPYDRDELRARLEVGKRMIELLARLIQSQKLAGLGNLAAGMAHEINSPLQVIIGGSESILRLTKDEKVDREGIINRAEMIQRNGWRIAKIIRALQDYSYSAEDQLDQFVTANLNTLVNDALLLIEHQVHEAQNIEIVQKMDPDLPDFICVRNKIIQTVLNLVSNAQDAVSPAGGTITLCTEFDPQPARIRLVVSDTGQGIPDNIHNRIFDPFFTTKPLGQGSGLGLSIVQGVVRAHGGEINVDSQFGTGTTFTLSFPLHPPDAELPAKAEIVARYDE